MKNKSFFIRQCYLILIISFISLGVIAQKGDGLLIKQANEYYMNSQYDLAIECCNKALKINASSPYAFNMRGSAFKELGKTDEAIADFTQAINFLPSYTNAYLLRASAYNQKGQAELAMADYNYVIGVDTTSEAAYYGRGNLYCYTKNYEKAISDYNQVVKLNSKTPDYYIQRGLCYYYQKNYDQSITDFSEAIILLPDSGTGYINRALAYGAQGKSVLALADYDKAIRTNPSDPLPYRYKGELNLRTKNYQAAVQDFSEALKVEPKNILNYVNRASSYISLGNFNQAFADVNEALQLDPNNSNAYLVRGFIHSRTEKYDNAIADFNLAIQQNPNSALFYINRGWAYKSQGNNELALADFEKAIQLEPQNEGGYVGRAAINFYKGDTEKSLLDLSKAILLNPALSKAYALRSSIYYFNGTYKLAIADCLEAIKLDPQDAYLYIDLFTNLLRTDDVQTAKEYYQKYKTENFNLEGQTGSWKFYDHYVTAITQGVLSDSPQFALNELEAAQMAYSADTSLNSTIKDERKYGFLDILFLKGYVLEKLNKYADAKIAYEQALAINKNQNDLKAALERTDDKKMIATISDNTPPEIQLITPQATRSFDIVSDQEETQIVGRAKDSSGISEVKINGTLIKAEEDGLFIASMPLKNGENVILISATDKRGNVANKTYTIVGTAAKKSDEAAKSKSSEMEALSAHYHAIIIAEQDYQDASIPDLANPIKDAREIKEILESQYTFKAANMDTLYNRNREDIMQGIIEKCNSLTDNDNLIIFYAGHGIAEKDKLGDYDGYWVPTSAKFKQSSTYISADDIIKAIKNSNARHILVIADACFSGSFTRNLPTDASLSIQKQYKNPSRKMMSSGNLEPVPDNSKFVYFLKKSLNSNTEKYMSAKKLFDSFYESVMNNSDTSPKYSAIKNVGDEDGEFIFIKK